VVRQADTRERSKIYFERRRWRRRERVEKVSAEGGKHIEGAQIQALVYAHLIHGGKHWRLMDAKVMYCVSRVHVDADTGNTVRYTTDSVSHLHGTPKGENAEKNNQFVETKG
jgi:hypothetical protein